MVTLKFIAEMLNMISKFIFICIDGVNNMDALPSSKKLGLPACLSLCRPGFFSCVGIGFGLDCIWVAAVVPFSL